VVLIGGRAYAAIGAIVLNLADQFGSVCCLHHIEHEFLLRPDAGASDCWFFFSLRRLPLWVIVALGDACTCRVALNQLYFIAPVMGSSDYLNSFGTTEFRFSELGRPRGFSVFAAIVRKDTRKLLPSICNDVRLSSRT